MQYKCKTVPVTTLITSNKGYITALCETCKSGDCSNPIEKRKVSMIGINKEMKVFSKGNEVGFVVVCEGYVK